MIAQAEKINKGEKAEGGFFWEVQKGKKDSVRLGEIKNGQVKCSGYYILLGALNVILSKM